MGAKVSNDGTSVIYENFSKLEKLIPSKITNISFPDQPAYPSSSFLIRNYELGDYYSEISITTDNGGTVVLIDCFINSGNNEIILTDLSSIDNLEFEFKNTIFTAEDVAFICSIARNVTAENFTQLNETTDLYDRNSYDIYASDERYYFTCASEGEGFEQYHTFAIDCTELESTATEANFGFAGSSSEHEFKLQGSGWISCEEGSSGFKKIKFYLTGLDKENSTKELISSTIIFNFNPDGVVTRP